MCSEGENFQLNFLIDEAQACGKGANSIVSMADSSFHTRQIKSVYELLTVWDRTKITL